MAGVQFNSGRAFRQAANSQIAEILDSIDATKLVRKLSEYRLAGGPRTYRIISFWRAYMLTFLTDLPSINALYRRLSNDPELMLLCGFSRLPHRTTFNRFVSRLSQHRDLVDEAMASVTDQLKALIPDLGEKIAVDSTTVETHAHPKRKSKITGQVSDPEASWTKKPSDTDPTLTEWFYGYKYHLVTDAVYQIPLTGFTTTAKQSDFPTLPKLLEQAESQFSWFKPKYVLADKGYDSEKNHKTVLAKQGAFICPTRKIANARKGLSGVFNKDGVPTCAGMELMQYIRTEPNKGHLYRCPNQGCQLKNRKGVAYCKDEYWVDWRTEPNKRLHGPIRRNSFEWKALYVLRQSVERVFKSMKESRRLERHYIRGLSQIALHSSMSALAYTTTVLVQTRAQSQRPLWMVERVA